MTFEKEDALQYHEKFIKYVWVKKDEPFVVGHHTREICKKVDEAIDRYKQGKSTFLIIKVPFRHGKSDMIPRYLPPRFQALFPEENTMIVAYGANLAEKFSRFARGVVKSRKYQDLVSILPGKRVLSKEKAAINSWGLEGYNGMVNASGIMSGITGEGYSLGILDDYCAGRADAESRTIRDKTWEAVSEDFLTRRASVSITIIQATPWHVDDVIARIEKRMREDKKFPQFEVISFPARSEKYLALEREKKSIYLFPERFGDDWYETQFATLGSYGSSSLLQCNPVSKGGRLLKTENIKTYSPGELPIGLRWARVWDLAHSTKERVGDDPDWTSGTLMAFDKKEGRYRLWIKDVVRFREEAPERNRIIERTAKRDGPTVKTVIERSLDAKDAFKILKEQLSGIISVRYVPVTGDKVSRMEPLEPIFEGGEVYTPEGAHWFDEWIAEVEGFPSMRHDDQVDNLSAGYAYLVAGGAGFDEDIRQEMAALRARQ